MMMTRSSSTPAEDPAKRVECEQIGETVRNLLMEDIWPKDILTRQAFENAMIVVNILGGSTSAVLHLIAFADFVGVKLTIDDFQAVSDKTPFLADLKPSGKYVTHDLYKLGGTTALLKFFLKERLINGSGITITGETMKENVASWPDFSAAQPIIRPLSSPIKPSGHLQILCESLTPGGFVGKITGKEVYGSKIKKEEKTSVIIRYEEPKGGSGMPEMLKPKAAIMGAGLANDITPLTDRRFSRGSHGFLIGHVVPEAMEGGPIALVKDDNKVVIDAEKRVYGKRKRPIIH